MDLTAIHPGTYLQGKMSIGHRLASFTRENVIGATSTSGSCHIVLDATFDVVSTRCQATALETKVVRVLLEKWPRLPPRSTQDEPGGEYLGSQVVRLAGHLTHEALRMGTVPGILLQPCVWVTFLPIISRAWIIVLQGGDRHTKAVSPTLCAGSSEEGMPGVSDLKESKVFRSHSITC